MVLPNQLENHPIWSYQISWKTILYVLPNQLENHPLWSYQISWKTILYVSYQISWKTILYGPTKSAGKPSYMCPTKSAGELSCIVPTESSWEPFFIASNSHLENHPSWFLLNQLENHHSLFPHLENHASQVIPNQLETIVSWFPPNQSENHPLLLQPNELLNCNYFSCCPLVAFGSLLFYVHFFHAAVP